MNIDEIDRRLKKELDDARYRHSKGVAKEAQRLAEIAGIDKDKAYLAGLVHDCAKCISYSDSVELAKKYGCKLDRMTLECRGVIHAPIGAIVAEYEYGIKDQEILDAIRRHTVAGENMTLLDKIVYIADMTEPGRDFDGVLKLRSLCDSDINSAYCEALKRSVIYNIKKGNIVHPDTLYAWNEMCIENKHKQREEKI